MDDFEFHSLSEGDEESILQFNRELIEQFEDLSQIDFPHVLEWERKKIHQYSAHYQSVWFLRQKAGFFLLNKADDKLELDDFFVFPGFQGKGIGSKVLQYCIRTAEEQNMPLFLCVFTRNQRAIKLYRRFGFQVTEKIGETRVIMQYSR